MKLSVVTVMWNVEVYGFPWREMLCESLRMADEVVVCVPKNSTDSTLGWLEAWKQAEPKLRVISWSPVEGSQQIAEATNAAIAAATGDLILSIQADEVLSSHDVDYDCCVEVVLDIKARYDQLMHSPCAIAFPRWDFTCSASHVTPIFDTEPPVTRLFAKRWFPGVGIGGDGMHVTGHGGEIPMLPGPHPIYHYHGLSTESGWQEKETRFQELYHDVGMPVDQRLKMGWGAWDETQGGTGTQQRGYPLPRPHPHIMGPWLSRADMFLRDPLRESP